MKRYFATLAELSRVSNLPTTFTNVMVGSAVASNSLLWWKIFAAWAAIACFYMAGMALNDVIDVEIDRVERPGRPICSGRISRRGAIAFVMALFAMGLSVLAVLSLPALLCGGILVISIVLYDLVHSFTVVSVVLMGACRGLIYLVAAAAMRWPLANAATLGTLASALALYTIIITLISRREDQSQIDSRKWLAALLLFIAAAPWIVIQPSEWKWALLALAIMLAWILHGVGLVFASPPRTRQAIVTWLAGMCLIDAFFLTLWDRPIMALVAGGCFVVTVFAQRKVLAS